MIRDDLGSRMKAYEAVTDLTMPGLTPIIVRVDGKAFHTLTKKLKKPFDPVFNKAMEHTMWMLCNNLPNVRFAFTQSDEISLVMLEKSIRGEAWFSNRLQKIVSLTAAYATRFFSTEVLNLVLNEDIEESDVANYDALINSALFDCRAFPIPERDVCNYFIWRQMDCQRNAVLSAGQAYIGKKEINGLSCNAIEEVLKEKGHDFLSFALRERRGATCYKSLTTVITPVTTENPGGEVKRMKFGIDINIPLFSDVRSFIEDHLRMEG